jgi:hypothetical protein
MKDEIIEYASDHIGLPPLQYLVEGVKLQISGF